MNVQVSAARALLGPLLAMVALAYLTALSILVTRLRDLLLKRNTTSFYEEYDGSGPVLVRRTTRQLANQFEFPMLFFAAITLAVACGLRTTSLQALAWGYIVLRWLHAAIHLTVNRLWIRTPVFMLSNFVLLALWIVVAVNLAPAAD